MGEPAEPPDNPAIVHTYPLCKHTDMQDDMKYESIETAVTAIEKYAENYDKAAKMIKETLDKKFGAPFNVVVGEAYSFSINFQLQTMILMYTGGNVAALIWRTVVQ